MTINNPALKQDENETPDTVVTVAEEPLLPGLTPLADDANPPGSSTQPDPEPLAPPRPDDAPPQAEDAATGAEAAAAIGAPPPPEATADREFTPFQIRYTSRTTQKLPSGNAYDVGVFWTEESRGMFCIAIWKQGNLRGGVMIIARPAGATLRQVLGQYCVTGAIHPALASVVIDEFAKG